MIKTSFVATFLVDWCPLSSSHSSDGEIGVKEKKKAKKRKEASLSLFYPHSCIFSFLPHLFLLQLQSPLLLLLSLYESCRERRSHEEHHQVLHLLHSSMRRPRRCSHSTLQWPCWRNQWHHYSQRDHESPSEARIEETLLLIRRRGCSKDSGGASRRRTPTWEDLFSHAHPPTTRKDSIEIVDTEEEKRFRKQQHQHPPPPQQHRQQHHINDKPSHFWSVLEWNPFGEDINTEGSKAGACGCVEASFRKHLRDTKWSVTYVVIYDSSSSSSSSSPPPPPPPPPPPHDSFSYFKRKDYPPLLPLFFFPFFPSLLYISIEE